MKPEFLSGIKTAIEHGSEALGPLIDEMIDWADIVESEREKTLQYIKILKWVHYNTKKINTTTILRMWCEFPITESMELEYWFWHSGAGNTMDVVQETSEHDVATHWYNGGLSVKVSVYRWLGTGCSCKALYDCTNCQNTGRVAALGPTLVLRVPVKELELTELPVIWTRSDVFDYNTTYLPKIIGKAINVPRYRTPEARRLDLEKACLDWARQEAGMKHDVNGEGYG